MNNTLAKSAALLWKNRLGAKAFKTAACGRPSFATIASTRWSGAMGGASNNSNNTRTPPFSAVRRRNSSTDGTAAEISVRGGAIIPGTPTEIHLPPAEDPVGLQLYQKAVYCPTTRVLRTSAHVGTNDDNSKANGIVGTDVVTPDMARNHARNSGLRLLATIHAALDGDLTRVERVLHLRGLVKSTPDFASHASVINGCSEVLVEAFGRDRGIGTRECFGVGSLGATVACTLELKIRPSGTIETEQK